jgi:hypothetical protein
VAARFSKRVTSSRDRDLHLLATYASAHRPISSASRRTPDATTKKARSIDRAFSLLQMNFGRSREDAAEEVKLPTTTTARGARGDGGSLELLEVLEHADHRVARGRVRLVGDRAAEADAQLGAKLRLDQAIRPERFLRIVMIEIRFTAGGSNPHGRECSSAATGLRISELLDRRAQPLTNQRNGRQGNQTIVVVVRPTEDRACH